MPAVIINENNDVLTICHTVLNTKRVAAEFYLNPVAGIRVKEISGDQFNRIQAIILEVT